MKAVILALVLFATAATGVASVAGAAPVAARLPKSCGGAQLDSSTSTTTHSPTTSHVTPVLLVHGFDSGPGYWHDPRGGAALVTALHRDVPRAAVYLFDYRRVATHWVDDPLIGPRLATSIVCVARATRRPVILIAHSMGGLAAEFAQGASRNGEPVARSLRLVVTIAAPYQGAQVLDVANGVAGADAPSPLVAALARALLTSCTRVTKRDGRLCAFVNASDTPAGRAMIPGSPQLAALPEWDPRIPLLTIAGSIQVQAAGVSVDIGDGLVATDSALSPHSSDHTGFTDGCTARALTIAVTYRRLGCSHHNVPGDRPVVERIVDRIRAFT